MEELISDTSYKISRYPGIQPFTKEYKDLFFGRDMDIDALLKVINVNDLLVLHGKSGLGKSSLINAGLIPKIEEQNGYRIIIFRFGAFNREYPTTPKEIFVSRINNFEESKQPFLPIIPRTDISIWTAFKNLQWNWRHEKGILLVLDQFEEVFSYPEGIEEFGRQLSELVFNRMPEDFQHKLYEWVEDQDSTTINYSDQIDFIEHCPPVKIIIGIRSDRLSFLDRFSTYIHNILKNTYELLPLSVEKALEAIVKPAQETKQEYISPPFRYDALALDHILSYLSNRYHRPVEPFLLQIICQYIENQVVQKSEHSGTTPISVSQSWISDLDAVTKAYYQNIITGLSSTTGQPRFDKLQQLLVRFFVEKNLIDGQSNNRISLDGAIVRKKGVDDALLEELVNSRLVRREPNTVSGVSYELSHDTLLEPVLGAGEDLGNLDELVYQYFYSTLVGLKGNKNRIQHIIETQLVDPSGQPVSVTNDEIEAEVLKILFNEKLVYAGLDKDGVGFIELMPIFLTPVLRQRGRLGAAQKKKYRILLFVSLLIFVLAISSYSFAIWAMNQKHKAEEAKAAIEIANRDVLRQKNISDSLLVKLQQQQKVTEDALQDATTQKNIAQIERTRTEKAFAQANIQRNSAIQARKLAEDLQTQEKRARQEAELQKELANQNKDLATQKVQLEEAKSLALQASFLLDEDPKLSFRLTEAAYQKDSFDLLIQKAMLQAFYRIGLPYPREIKKEEIQYPLSQKSNFYTFEKQGDNHVLLYDPEGTLISSFSVNQTIKSIYMTLDNSYLVVETVSGQLLSWVINPLIIIQIANENGIPILTNMQKRKFGIK